MRLFLIYRCRRSTVLYRYIEALYVMLLKIYYYAITLFYIYNMDDAFIYCGGHYSRTRTRTRKLLPTVNIF